MKPSLAVTWGRRPSPPPTHTLSHVLFRFFSVNNTLGQAACSSGVSKQRETPPQATCPTSLTVICKAALTVIYPEFAFTCLGDSRLYLNVLPAQEKYRFYKQIRHTVHQVPGSRYDILSDMSLSDNSGMPSTKEIGMNARLKHKNKTFCHTYHTVHFFLNNSQAPLLLANAFILIHIFIDMKVSARGMN